MNLLTVHLWQGSYIFSKVLPIPKESIILHVVNVFIFIIFRYSVQFQVIVHEKFKFSGSFEIPNYHDSNYKKGSSSCNSNTNFLPKGQFWGKASYCNLVQLIYWFSRHHSTVVFQKFVVNYGMISCNGCEIV